MNFFKSWLVSVDMPPFFFLNFLDGFHLLVIYNVFCISLASEFQFDCLYPTLLYVLSGNLLLVCTHELGNGWFGVKLKVNSCLYEYQDIEIEFLSNVMMGLHGSYSFVDFMSV